MVVGTYINGLMVLVTLTIAWVAWRTFKSQTRPKIIVYTHHDYLRAGYLKIRIHNIGKDVAKDISFKMEPMIPDVKGPLLSKLPSLAPGEYRDSGWGMVFNLKEKTSGATYKVKYEYRHGRKTLHGEDIIETDSYDEELTRLSPYQDIVKAIEGRLDDILREVSVLSRQWKEYVSSRSCDNSKE